MPMSEKPETRLQRQIKEALVERYGQNIWILKTHGSIYQKRGLPDFLIALYGRFCALEIKTPGKEPSLNQTGVAWEMRYAGIHVGWTDSVEGALAWADDIVQNIKQCTW